MVEGVYVEGTINEKATMLSNSFFENKNTRMNTNEPPHFVAKCIYVEGVSNKKAKVISYETHI